MSGLPGTARNLVGLFTTWCRRQLHLFTLARTKTAPKHSADFGSVNQRAGR